MVEEGQFHSVSYEDIQKSQIRVHDDDIGKIKPSKLLFGYG